MVLAGLTLRILLINGINRQRHKCYYVLSLEILSDVHHKYKYRDLQMLLLKLGSELQNLMKKFQPVLKI